MDVIPLEVFVGLVLVAGALLLLAWSLARGDHEHADRLALLPLEKERTTPAAKAAPRPAEPPAGGARE